MAIASISHVRISGFVDHPLLGDMLFIQVCICWIRLQNFHLSKPLSYLNGLFWRRLELEHPVELAEHESSLSSSWCDPFAPEL